MIESMWRRERKEALLRIPEFEIPEAPDRAGGGERPPLKKLVASTLRETRGRLLQLRKQGQELAVLMLETRKVLVEICDLLDKYRGLAALARREQQNARLAPEWVRRVERMREDLGKTLAGHDVAERRPAGRPQPGLDCVVGQEEAPGISPGEIARVVRTGYLWRGEVLRTSEVIVASQLGSGGDQAWQ